MRLATLVLALLLVPSALAQAGTPDPTFGTDGVARLVLGASDNAAAALVPLAGGETVAAGKSDGRLAVFRLLPDGTLDATFGTDGIATVDIGGHRSFAQTLVRLADGRLVVGAGRADADDIADGGALIAFTAAGALDMSFGTGGIVAGDIIWSDLDLDTSGRIVATGTDISGQSGSQVAIARFSETGAQDTGFGVNGVARPGGEGFSVTRSALAADGRIVVAGSVFGGGFFDSDPSLVRLAADGQTDATFGTDGVVVLAEALPFGTLRDIAVDSAGRIVAAGLAVDFATTQSEGFVTRLLPDGTLDASFSDDGTTRVVTGDALVQVAGLQLQPNDKILTTGVAGALDEASVFVARFKTDGALDGDFGTGGVTVLPVTAQTVELGFDVALAADGSVMVAGYEGNGEPSRYAVVARLENDVIVASEPRADGGALALRHAGANPSAAGRVALRLDAPQSVRLTAYDVLGRAVAVLHDGPLGTGEHAFDLGGALAPGAYLIRAAAADGGSAVLSATVAR